MKTCKRCNQTFPATLEYFYANKTNNDGLMGKCRTCKLEETREYKKENLDLVHARGRRYRLGLIGFTPELVEEMRNAQNNKCALCKTDEPGGNHNEWHSDHDHKTGKARGLLCARCNWAVGHIDDKGIDWAHLAIEYVKNGGFHD